MEETDNICFVCDKIIQAQKWKYKLQVTATKKRNVPVADLIKQLVGDEYALLVGERDAVCSRCMNLLNLMDSLTAELGEVQSTLSQLLKAKYNLTSESIKFQVQYDDSIMEETEVTEPLNKCERCSFQTKYEKEFVKHMRTHTAPKSSSKSAPIKKTIDSKSSSKTKSMKPPSKTKPAKPSLKSISIKPLKSTSIKPSAKPTSPKISAMPKLQKSIVNISLHNTRSNNKRPPRIKKIPKKFSDSFQEIKSTKVSKPKKKKILFQCSVCNKLFPNENVIRAHAKKEHGNDNIVVSDDEYEDIQTLESDEENAAKNKSKNKKKSKVGKQQMPTKPKLDFLEDWEEEDEVDDIFSPAKKLKSEDKIALEPRKTKISVEPHTKSVENFDEEENYDKDTSSKPTCLFCHAKFSSFESVQDHIKMSHRDRSSSLNIVSKSTTISVGSVASFEIDSTTDIAENKIPSEVDISNDVISHKSYKCNLCGIKKVSLQFIQQHIKAHKKKLSLQCKFCGISFKNIVALKIHSSKCHKAASIPKKCCYCKFKFFDNIQLKNHVRKVHHKKLANSKLSKIPMGTTGTFSSSESSVKSKSKLPNTIKTSDLVDKSVIATDCSKISVSEVSSTSFDTETESTKLAESADVEIKDQAEKSTKINQDQKEKKTPKSNAQKSPSKGKFECQECGTTFAKQSRLVDHLNRHKASTCLKLGICVFCEKLFLDKDQVIIHTNTIHENMKTQPKCSVCGKIYSYAKDMKIHYLRCHFSETMEKLMKQLTEFKINETENTKSFSNNDANDVYSKVFKELQDLTGEGNDIEDVSAISCAVPVLNYSCPLCDFSSSFQDAVKSHLTSHTQNYCNICKNVFSPVESIKHIENHSIEFQDKKCPECENKFHDDIHLQYHIQSVHPEKKPHKCSMCLKSYFSEKSMLNHKHSKHGKKSFKVFSCSECRMNFYSEKKYQIHVEYAHRISLNCKYCDKTLSDIKKIVIHERNHLKQVKSIYKCNICGKVLKTQVALKTHKINHTSSKPLQCGVCSQIFKSFHTLREHSAKHSEVQDKKYFCDICGKGFYFYDSHIRHRRLHLDPLLFQCKICKERFQTSQKLEEHKKTCTADAKCAECLKSFKNNSDLDEHACLLETDDALS